MNKLARGLATAAVASALIIGPAAAANATYVPGVTNPASAPAIVAGGTGTVGFAAGTFAPNVNVSFTLSGNNAANATLASTKTITKPADANGAVSVSVTLPANASGTYTLTGTQGAIVESQTITVAAADSAAGDNLANTGSDSAAAFWFAGGLLALGATTVVTLNVVRRNRAQA